MFCRDCGSGGPDYTVLCHSCGSSIHSKKENPVSRGNGPDIRTVLCMLAFAAAALLFVYAVHGANGERIPVSKEFDEVLAYGDGYYLVMAQRGAAGDSGCMIGVVDSDARWIQPLSEDHIFLRESGPLYGAGREKAGADSIKENIYYIGEGMFLMAREEAYRDFYTGIVYNARDDIGFTVRQYGPCDPEERYKPAVAYKDGYWVILRGRGEKREICIADRRGHIRTAGKKAETLGQYSDGLFFADGRFYDLHLRPALDLTGYRIINRPYFQNGRSSLFIEAGNGKKYEVEINKNGKLLRKPKEVSDGTVHTGCTVTIHSTHHHAHPSPLCGSGPVPYESAVNSNAVLQNIQKIRRTSIDFCHIWRYN